MWIYINVSVGGLASLGEERLVCSGKEIKLFDFVGNE